MVITDEESYKIQLLRGIAIIAVVAIHNTPVGLTQVFVRPFINFSVGMFLFISGMLSNASTSNPWKRIKKVLIPYFIWTMLYVIVMNYKTPLQIPVIFFKKILTGDAVAVMYYVFVYCEMTLLIPIIDKLAKSRFRYLGFVISPVEIIVMRIIPLVTGYEMNKYVNILMNISCLGWFAYYYLGYLIGNNIIKVNISIPKLVVLCNIGIVLQFVEGYWYFKLGDLNCGTQLKLSSVLTGIFIVLISYKFIISTFIIKIKYLHLLGNCSFGIFFSHLAVQGMLGKIPYYKKIVVFPLNAIVVIVLTTILVLIGRKFLGKSAKYLAF